MKKAPITQDELHRLLNYDQLTGVFTRKVRTNHRVQVGDVASCSHDRGYVCVPLLGKKILAHRLAWLYVTGEWPENEIDHVDGNRANNAFSNLRKATSAQNKQNIRRPTASNVSTGLLGAAYCRGAFQAIIKVNGKSNYLGRFPTPELAHQAYLDAKRKLHPFNTI